MAILIESDDAAVELLRSALSAGDGLEVIESEGQLPAVLARRSLDSLVIFGPDTDLHSALDFAAAQRVQRPALGVILIRRRVDSALLAQAMRGLQVRLPGHVLAELAAAISAGQPVTLP